MDRLGVVSLAALVSCGVGFGLLSDYFSFVVFHVHLCGAGVRVVASSGRLVMGGVFRSVDEFLLSGVRSYVSGSRV